MQRAKTIMAENSSQIFAATVKTMRRIAARFGAYGAAVLQMHMAIEDLLNSMMICRVLGVKPSGNPEILG